MTFKKLLAFLYKHGLTVLLLYNILIRLLVLLFYRGITYFPDSGDYVDLAERILNGNLIGYHGARTPGYSMFLALLGNNHIMVVIVQNLLGLVILFMIFDLSKQWTSQKMAFYIGLILSSYLPFIFYDFAILTESLSAFLLVTLMWLLNKVDFFKTQHHHLIVYLKIGVLCAVLFLVRPFFIYLPFLIILFVAVTMFNEFKSVFFPLILVLVIPVLALLSWNSFNKYNTGVFMTSSYEGINLTQVGTSFYEKLPDQYHIEREILLRHRDEIVATKEGHVYPMTVWFAREELKQATALNDLELSLHLKKISINLLLAHPVDYGKQAVFSFTKFFGAESTLLWNVDKFKNKWIRKGLVSLWIYGQQYALIVLNSIFILFSFLFLFKNGALKKWNIQHFVILMIISGAIFQALITFGTNSRFCYPFTGLILAFTINYLYKFQKIKNTP